MCNYTLLIHVGSIRNKHLKVVALYTFGLLCYGFRQSVHKNTIYCNTAMLTKGLDEKLWCPNQFFMPDNLPVTFFSAQTLDNISDVTIHLLHQLHDHLVFHWRNQSYLVHFHIDWSWLFSAWKKSCSARSHIFWVACVVRGVFGYTAESIAVVHLGGGCCCSHACRCRCRCAVGWSSSSHSWFCWGWSLSRDLMSTPDAQS